MARGVKVKETAGVVEEVDVAEEVEAAVKKETKRVACVITPLWSPFIKMSIGYEPVEVIVDNWLECQIAAGLIVEM